MSETKQRAGILSEFKKIRTVALGAVTFGPLGLWPLDLAPPWPNGSSVIATVFAFCVIGVVATRWRNGLADQKERMRRIVGPVLMGVGLLLITGYIACFSLFTHELVQPQSDGREAHWRIVTGWDIRPDAGSADDNVQTLLQINGFKSDNVFTSGSLLGARLLVLLTFCLWERGG